jgi:hypothetical protein
VKTINRHRVNNDEERSFTGTWVTDELKKALENGYVVQRIYEVWHFDETEQYDDFAFDESFVLLYICKTLGDDLRVSDGYISGLIDIWIQVGYIEHLRSVAFR